MCSSDLHSFPTRRSSDLTSAPPAARGRTGSCRPGSRAGSGALEGLLVYLITTDLGKVIALAAEVHAIEERGGVVPRGRLTRALTTVDLQEGVVTIGRDVALDGRAYEFYCLFYF